MTYMNTTRKTRRSLFIEDEQWHALGAVSEQTGAPIAELVRRAIKAYLEQQKGKDSPDKGRKK